MAGLKSTTLFVKCFRKQNFLIIKIRRIKAKIPAIIDGIRTATRGKLPLLRLFWILLNVVVEELCMSVFWEDLRVADYDKIAKLAFSSWVYVSIYWSDWAGYISFILCSIWSVIVSWVVDVC